MFEDPESDPQLQAVQALLRRDAQLEAPHAGLSARVYRASVAFLPGRDRVRASTWAWHAAASRIPVWGRLALAASIALAFALASRLVEPGPPTSTSPLSAPEIVALLDEAAGGVSEGIEALAQIREITVNDIADEVAMLRADLESESDT